MTTVQLIAAIIAFCVSLGVILTIIYRPRKRGHGISLLVPFRADNDRRQETWNWLRRYWEHELPGAEIIVSTDDHIPFCKTAAVNAAADKAKGDVIVILDADCYLSGDVIEYCANEIRKERKRGNRLWFMPYRNFYRLTETASLEILNSDPKDPPRFFAAQPPSYKLEKSNATNIGHWFGALIQIMPSEAFTIAGKMDTRFYGWGGEDVAFMHALDTLYIQHKTVPSGVIHLWHPSIGTNAANRKWFGQQKPGTNSNLASKYHRAMGDAGAMGDLVKSHENVKPIDRPTASPRIAQQSDDIPERFYE